VGGGRRGLGGRQATYPCAGLVRAGHGAAGVHDGRSLFGTVLIDAASFPTAWMTERIYGRTFEARY